MLIRQQRLDLESGDSFEIIPLYDNADSPIGIIYDKISDDTFTPRQYWFLKNLQGDVLSLLDEDGVEVVRYTYNDWGQVTIAHDVSGVLLGHKNPFRWRGYEYEEDTTLYYLVTRYYDSKTGRFLNEDDHAFLGASGNTVSYNLYTYCENDPVNFKDETGQSVTAILIGIGIGALVGTLAGWGYAKYFKIPKNSTWKFMLGGALIGAVIGGCIGYALGAGSGAVLWSGKGMDTAAAAFARKNGLKVLEQTLRGRLLTVLGKVLPWSVMRPLWVSASTRFLLSYAGKQTFVHVFVTATAYNNMQSVFNSVELQVVAELGLKIIWHFVK